MIVAIVNFTFPEPMSLEAATTAFQASAPSYQQIPGLATSHERPSSAASAARYLSTLRILTDS